MQKNTDERESIPELCTNGESKTKACAITKKKKMLSLIREAIVLINATAECLFWKLNKVCRLEHTRERERELRDCYMSCQSLTYLFLKAIFQVFEYWSITQCQTWCLIDMYRLLGLSAWHVYYMQGMARDPFSTALLRIKYADNFNFCSGCTSSFVFIWHHLSYYFL